MITDEYMNKTRGKKVLVVGAGLAGSEAAFFLARHGIEVVLVEAKKKTPNPAQKLETYAELVCSNSLKSMKPETGHGLLKKEMEDLGSLILEVASEVTVPAGNAMAVDRVEFSRIITEKLKNSDKITIVEEEVADPVDFAHKFDCDDVIVASGPLTTKPLEDWIRSIISKDDFYFYDAIAPVVELDGLDLSKLYFKDRYKDPVNDDVKADYLNAPFNKDEYERFIEELLKANKVPARDFEKWVFFEGCLPIDLMAERGEDTPRFSCMKPVGLEKEDGSRPYAAVQLRRENLPGDAFNIVGFQTRLTYKEQLRVFRMIPGLENANFIHYGSVHRNSFLHSKKVLNFDLSSKKFPDLYFAGQITGVEGYTESAAIGIYVAYQIVRKINADEVKQWPCETAIGALINYLMTADKPRPNNIHFGLLPNVDVKKPKRISRQEYKKMRKMMVYDRARKVFESFFHDYVLF
ncbi:MAG: methylenetetrahydrofolate--tRNA-(uracil(54)-C(5))-methyltransferase (FADH(2)-oxidizing) TrmFO [Bacteriovoracaceae bacterium]|nr:methylenetetrahydrofolate--tRNA-(uracil(54)-C(5))-methyltransferase (FADH(2)-oxidizing) TrmFO [Bacteriovoracaceae bacterium]